MPTLLNPLVDPDGKRWFDPSSAAKRLGYAATASTLARWAENGKTSFGMPIESKRVPLLMTTRHTEGSSFKPKRPRTDRPVIAEEAVNALNAVFQEVFQRKRKHRAYSKDELARLETAARRFAPPSLISSHL